MGSIVLIYLIALSTTAFLPLLMVPLALSSLFVAPRIKLRILLLLIGMSLLSGGLPVTSYASLGLFLRLLVITVALASGLQNLLNIHLSKLRVGIILSVILFFSCVMSVMPLVSTSKTLYFLYSLIALSALATTITSQEALVEIRGWLTGLCVLSLMVYFIPSIAYNRTLSLEWKLYQGVLNHPQTLSVISSLAILLELNSAKRKSIKNRIVITCWLILLFLSKGRVGLFVLLFAGGLKLLPALYLVRKKRIFTRILLYAPIATLGILFSHKYLMSFIFKRDGISNLTESVAVSREGQILHVWSNITNYYLSGIGFGVPSSLALSSLVTFVPGTNIPISVPTEKGFFFLAFLEEFGLISGLVVFAIFIRWLYKYSISSEPMAFGILALLAANFVEYFLFSLNGIGFILWLLICLNKFSVDIDEYRKHISSSAY